MILRNRIICIALLCVSTAFIGCDMRHAVRIQQIDAINTPRDLVQVNEFSLENVLITMSPIIEKHKMECTTIVNQYGREITCKTSAISTTKLKLTERNGSTQVLVEDESPIFFWTPQPYGKIRSDVQKILIETYGVKSLACGQGFGLVIPYEGWPK